jgi:hypothetical protein
LRRARIDSPEWQRIAAPHPRDRYASNRRFATAAIATFFPREKHSMLKRIGIMPAVCVLAAFNVQQAGIEQAVAAEDCLPAPTHEPPEGSHWYYRSDPIRNHKCWYLAEAGHPVLPRPPAAAAERAGRREELALNRAQRDALFQEFVRWKTLQRALDKP